MKRILMSLAVIVTMAVGAAAQAATINYVLNVDPTAGAWSLTADTDAPGGIAGFTVDLVNVSSGTSVAPRADFSGTAVSGFTLGNVFNGNQAFAGQNTTAASSLVYGLGYAPVAPFATAPFSQLGDPTAVPTELYNGTFDTAGAMPDFGQLVQGNVFQADSGTATMAADVTATVNVVPEPVTMTLLAVGAPLLLKRRRSA
jgi:hypothetical protein